MKIMTNVLTFSRDAVPDLIKLLHEKVAFTKASVLDGVKTTVSLTALGKASGQTGALKKLQLGSELILTINSVKTVFIVNRKGRTAFTKAFPRTLRLPTVGSPVNANVTDVEIL